MDTQSYAALASVTKYWYLILIALIFLSLVLVSVSEYRQKKKIRKEVGRFVGYLEQKGSQDRIGLTEENILGSGSRCRYNNRQSVRKKDSRSHILPRR